MAFRKRLEAYSTEYIKLMSHSNNPDHYNPKNIEHLLKAPNSFSRYCGVLKLDKSDEQNVKHLLTLANDADEIVRYALAQKLGHIQTNDSLKTLTNLLTDKSCNVKRCVIESLAKFQNDSTAEKIENSFNDKCLEVKIESAKQIYLTNDDKSSAIEYVEELLSDRRKGARLSALKIIEKHFKIRDLYYLITDIEYVLEKDKYPEIREYASSILQNAISQSSLLDDFIGKMQELKADEYLLSGLLSYISSLSDERISGILRGVLSHNFVADPRIDIWDYEEEEDELKRIAVDYFLNKFDETGDDDFLYDLFMALINNMHICEFVEYIFTVFKKIDPKKIVNLADNFLFGEIYDIDDETASVIIRATCSLDSKLPEELLCDYFEFHNSDSYISTVLFDYGDEILDLLESSKNPKLFDKFFEAEFFNDLDEYQQEAVILRVAKSKSFGAVKSLSRILFSDEYDITIRQKAAEGLKEIGKKGASQALQKLEEYRKIGEGLEKRAKSKKGGSESGRKKT